MYYDNGMLFSAIGDRQSPSFAKDDWSSSKKTKLVYHEISKVITNLLTSGRALFSKHFMWLHISVYSYASCNASPLTHEHVMA